jgi:hypothetical protein
MKIETPDPPWNIHGASGCKLYKVYVAEWDEKNKCCDALMIEADSEHEKQRAGILDGMKFVRYIIAHSWTEAMKKHHLQMNWEPYVPFEMEA